jgi:alpha-amylase
MRTSCYRVTLRHLSASLWPTRKLCVTLLALLLCLSWAPAWAQSGFEDDRVMLQGFYWESYRHGHPDKFPTYGTEVWYEIVKQQANRIRGGRFDLIWLPPPSYAGQFSAGYNPKEYFRLDNSYGTFQQHRAMVEALLQHGVEPIADIVLNHRDGSEQWADFKNPTWGTWAITRNDEAFTNQNSQVFNTPEAERGAPEEVPQEYAGQRGSTYGYDAFRDLDHTNATVRQDILRYLLALKSLGYRGWRYDMVHGFHARWVAFYNKMTTPTFSVGEYDWGAHNEQRGWMWYTATAPTVTGEDHLKTSSSVFDFTTFFALKDNKGAGRYFVWYGFGNGVGMVGDTTDNLRWKNRAVTFLENHDTGYRTNEDGTPQEHHKFDSFANTWEVEQAYAQILTHPGVPCVYWKHYFDWGGELRNKIGALINARKVAGVHAGSALHLQENARANGVYAARVDGRNGELYIRIGGTDADWQPSFSNYQDYREYARGAGWTVWVKLPGNPEVRQASLKSPIPVPSFIPPNDIDVPEVPQ